MRERQAQLVDVVLKDPGIDGVISVVGADTLNATTNNGLVLINLKPRDQRDASASEIIDRLRPKLAPIEGVELFMQPSQDINVGGRLSRTQFQYTLQDANLDELNHWSPILLRALQANPLLRDVATDHQIAGPTLSLAINRDAAARLGVSTQAIDDTLYDAFGQRKIAQFFTQLNSYWVVLEVDPAFHLDPNALDLIYVPATNGRQVPLGSLVTTTSTVRSLSVSHRGQFPSTTLSFNLAPGIALSQAVDAITQAKQELNAPDTLIATFQGNAQAYQASLKSQPLLILAAVIAVYIILGILYESFVHPITILSTIPSAGVRALGFLLAFHYELSVIALIGIILLIGIVKKNAIMMIDFALHAERTQGLSPEQSIYQASLLRFRPIMMTTMAALLGGVPLALGHGEGSEYVSRSALQWSAACWFRSSSHSTRRQLSIWRSTASGANRPGQGRLRVGRPQTSRTITPTLPLRPSSDPAIARRSLPHGIHARKIRCSRIKAQVSAIGCRDQQRSTRGPAHCSKRRPCESSCFRKRKCTVGLRAG
jgi:multidrug efflux pump subunit AcrB